eukprot:7722870-Alexandrium_andersonii.AAC.1
MSSHICVLGGFTLHVSRVLACQASAVLGLSSRARVLQQCSSCVVWVCSVAAGMAEPEERSRSRSVRGRSGGGQKFRRFST